MASLIDDTIILIFYYVIVLVNYGIKVIYPLVFFMYILRFFIRQINKDIDYKMR